MNDNEGYDFEIDLDVVKQSQSKLEATLLDIARGSDPFPRPGRPVRQAVGYCFVSLYDRGETRTLFDTLQSLVKVAADPKPGDRDARPVLLRFHAITALQKSLSNASRALTESSSKDILKHMRDLLSGKVLPLQRAASRVLIVIFPLNDGSRAVADVETIVNLCIKSLENVDQLTRQALGQLAAHMLASTQVVKTVPTEQSKKSGSKKDPNLEEKDESTIPGPISGPRTLVLSPEEMLLRLSSQFNKPSATRKMRIGIIEFYATLFSLLGPQFVESNYGLILRHLMQEIVQTPKSIASRYEKLLIRKLVSVLLRDLIGARMLSEQGQIGAIHEISSSYLKRWPALLPGQVAPSPLVLVIALKEVAALLQQLGNAPPPVQDALSGPLVELLSHPNHSTRIASAWALRCFCHSTPLRLPKIGLTMMETLQRNMSSISTPAAPSDIDKRALGHAYGLAALFAVIPERPLYISYDTSAKTLDMAVQLLKRSGDHDLKIAFIEVEVAWTCIASIMSLGPNFVRSHLPQLLVLWRNALPKPTSKDTMSGTGRSVHDWMFMLHVRECALGAILSFLRHNSPALVTLDVSRRISSLLSNALTFSQAYMGQKFDELQDGTASVTYGGLDSTTREALMRRRVYECFSVLGFSTLTETSQLSLLQSTVVQFASPEAFSGSSVQAAIAASSGNFTSVWHSTDNYAYGVTSINFESPGLDGDSFVQSGRKSKLSSDMIDLIIDASTSTPVIGSCEHEPLTICQTKLQDNRIVWPEPPPPMTSVTDAAIGLFSFLLAEQDVHNISKVITQLIDFVRSPKLDKNPGRKAAVLVNTAVALLLALRQVISIGSRNTKDAFASAQISDSLADFLKNAIVNGDIVLRNAGSEALGRLASLAGTSFLTTQVKTLVDLVVSNRDPNGRAGCALAFGAIYSHVGGLAAGPLLKTTINVLMSLGNDPHPVVHFWALTALGQVINAASLAYSAFVPSTIGMLFKLYMLDTHEPEGGPLSSVNVSGDLPTYRVVCQIIDALIGVVGPELQESISTRTLILDLVEEFNHETEESIAVEAIMCIQHFLIFTPEHVGVRDLVDKLRIYLSSSRRPLKMASINALYQMVQRDALSMSKIGGDQLVEELFGMLDDTSTSEGVRSIISSWLRQTVIHNPSAWIDLCQRIMSRITATTKTSNTKTIGGQDDEAESFAGSTDPLSQDRSSTARWQTQLFALNCLHDICSIVGKSDRREHIDIPFARRQGLLESQLLVSRVPDLIKMAFTASAAYVTEIRLAGLVVLRDIFSNSPDPDYEDTLLLEQHQAPITAALTPAFSADSTPEILASAVQVCAIFVGCGVVRDVSKMGRILKLLTSALEQSKSSGLISIGDVGELSPNASVMLRISTLAAWAELEAATSQQPYLKLVVAPHRPVLASLWIASLRDYASVRVDSEALQNLASLDPSYSSLGREILLPYYDQSWGKVLKAVATGMLANDPYILAAMDGKDSLETSLGSRDNPTAFFYIVFGLVYDALTSTSTDAASGSASREMSITALQTLKCLVRPEYCGKAILDPAVFQEFSSLCYRMAVTESAVVQLHLVEAIVALATSQKTIVTSYVTLLKPLSRADTIDRNPTDNVFPDSHATHCLRICAYVLRHALPNTRTSIPQGEGNSPSDRIRLLLVAFNSFTAIGRALGPIYQEEVRAVGVALYADLLKDERSDIDITGPTLPALKALLEPPSDPKVCVSESKYGKLVHGLISACLVNIDEMSGRVGLGASNKVKNNLLAAVLILTVIPSSLTVSRTVVDHCCFIISQKLLESDETSLTSAHCAKTLVATASSGNPVLQYCVKLLVPGMITFIANAAALSDAPEKQKLHTSALEEILKALASLLPAVPETSRPTMLGILLPTLSLLLNPSKASASPFHMMAVTHLLSFAAASPAAFKEAAAKLDQGIRDSLESSIRQAVGGNKLPQPTTVKPQISLRSF
ncbi:hypothetical protein Clacol_003263 [Clathrus columnatus]|uniref:LAA1-like C-terminal TPR repeats domain-containing protein n=1 Tax=Clathrus columnatus TaxID=1419009 RepID=A0AAV5A7Q8_9AGAM|nr:hypothetical protein Clacol_003263 [Clathrus columnatus]